MVVEDLTGRLTALSNQLEAALELSASLQAQRNAAQSIISALELKVNALESLVRTDQQALPAVKFEVPPPPALTTVQPRPGILRPRRVREGEGAPLNRRRRVAVQSEVR